MLCSYCASCNIRQYENDVDALLTAVYKVIDLVLTVRVDWSSLEWTTRGPSVLFEQLKMISSQADSLDGMLLTLGRRKGEITSKLGQCKAQLEKLQDDSMQKNSRIRITSGQAIQERMAFAKLDVGDAIYVYMSCERKIAIVEDLLSSLRNSIKRLIEFKYDAKLLQGLLTLGHQLGEL